MKRKERHKIKRSEITPYITKALDFFKSYQREFLIAAIVILIVIIAGSLYRYNRNKKIKSANLVFYQAMKERSVEKLKELKNYPSPFPQIASIILAGTEIQKGKANQALEELQKYEDKGTLRDLILFMEAKILCSQGKVKEAMDKFSKIKEKGEVPLDALLFEKAFCLEKAGKFGEALTTYRLITEKFQGSPYYSLALNKIESLGVR